MPWEGLLHTLQPTALVSELFVKLSRSTLRIVDQEHYFRLAARAMRHMLADHARLKKAKKRIAPDAMQDLFQANSEQTDPETLYALRSALEKLRTIDARAAETIVLRAVEGLTISEIGHLQKTEPWRVRANYDFARKWIAEQLSGIHR